jgi:hypothetical protein
VIVSRAALLGLLALLMSTTGCVSGASRAEDAAAAVPAYTPPAGAPPMCERLAGSSHFVDIPHAIGRLASGTQIVEARTELAAARRELRAMVTDLPQGESPVLRAAAEDLTDALREVLDRPDDASARAALVSGVAELVAQLEPVCDYPA